MRTIDFTPPWYRRACATVSARHRAMVLCAGLAAGMVMVGGSGAAQLHWTREQLAHIWETSQQHQPLIQRIEALRTELAGSQERISRCESLAGGVPSHAILAELSRLVPAGTALTHVELRQPPCAMPKPMSPSAANDGVLDAEPGDETPDDLTQDMDAEVEAPTPASTGRLRVEGVTCTAGDVGRLVDGLSRSPICEHVKLDHSRPGAVQGRSVVAFRISCDVPLFE
ncbi:MAG: PilN domain-containing protein [Phycisphaerales bacterium]|nr:PilN domain-containing protein [Phycisphaerales bacterium]